MNLLKQWLADHERYLLNGTNYERAVVLTIPLIGIALGFLILRFRR